MKPILNVLLAFLFVGTFVRGAETKPNPWAFDPNPSLPDVLLIGDSISIGYTVPVRESLDGKANVYRPMNASNTGPINCASTYLSLNDKLIDKFLSQRKWAVIHFNWGLWDITYCNPPSKRTDLKSKRDKVNGAVSVTPEEYERNLEALVEKLKKTGAKLIWASTTLVPEGQPGRFVGDEVKYNQIAERIMKKHGIEINDLHALTKEFDAKLFAGPADVHFNAAGSKKIAQQVAEKIGDALTSKP